ncbi:hypothetical protein H4J50_07760 [Colwellia sp. 6M3]|jgi:hypothetical protein|uniref:hypothetical protein n=1 Tax=Colwellia sp. 6M3 TaxID=2759849 RepID=UPI0015F719E1|nr:hypothetical protein [Colwellia sp. 6M3]MBA6415909.1 hypothetical protein [Colwellia sp. 6M3]|tara:strand:- start:591 stop:791 length:201 start_codon:yes stop_codon:yes gene_type:complete
MSVELNTNSTVPMSTETILAVKSANLSKSQTELEGQMALALIESASVGNESLAVVGNIGQNINIKA